MHNLWQVGAQISTLMPLLLPQVMLQVTPLLLPISYGLYN